MIPLAEPVLNGNELRYLQECIDTGYVSSVGPFVERFEKEFIEIVGVGYGVGCASGTAALHVALQVAGAKPGELVAVSDFTFIASANAIKYTGADVLLVDSETATWNMNTELLRDEVFKRSRLGKRIPTIVEVVHIVGHPAEMEPLLELRDRFEIRVIEDAAEALGASWEAGVLAGEQVGSVGDINCFSFNGNKIVTCGGGGMITTGNCDLARRARHLTNQAKISSDNYVHDMVGYNYRLTNLAAAVGVAQLERLKKFLHAKRVLAGFYDGLLGPLSVTRAPRANWAKPSYWLYSILFNDPSVDPDKIVAALANDGIRVRRLWPPLHQQQPYLSTERIGGQVAASLYRRGISLPSYVHLSKNEQATVVAALTRALKQA